MTLFCTNIVGARDGAADAPGDGTTVGAGLGVEPVAGLNGSATRLAL